jgi:hypothetical protein
VNKTNYKKYPILLMVSTTYKIVRYSSQNFDFVKVKQSQYRPEQALRVPAEAEAPRFQGNRYMKVVRLSVLRTVHLYPQEIFLVLISFRG